MLGAFRRSAASTALRLSSRTLTARSSPLRLQSLYASIPQSSYAPKSLFHSTSFRFDSQAAAAIDNGVQQAEVAQENTESLTKFQDLADKGIISKGLIRTITKGMRLETMTDVQRLTIPESLKGGDMLAQAKTGTGKTVAFLIPVIERLIQDTSVQKARMRRGRMVGPRDIRALIISPTRELAEQIAVEATRMAGDSGLIVQTAVGGTQKREGLRRIRDQGCHILVGTPGRLKDILSDPSSGIEAPRLSAFVLDEADRLLDQGFAPELEDIQNQLPDRLDVDRQTLMFSATIAKEVMSMVRQTMKPDFQFVKTVDDNETPTHLSVPQRAVVLAGLENTFPALLELVKRSMNDEQRPFKAIVYFSSTKQVETAYQIFKALLIDPENPRSGNPLGKMFLGEIHSRLSQAARTRVADRYRRCRSGILFSSDVTARGMDFPGVTSVIQVGSPSNRADYIHRLGRTARAGKTGEGWILLHEQEYAAFKRMARDIPVEADASLVTSQVDMTTEYQTTPEATETLDQAKGAIAQIPIEDKGEAVKTQMANLIGSFNDMGALQYALHNLSVHGYGLRNAPPMPQGLRDRMRSGSSDYYSRRNDSRGGRGGRDNRSGGRRNDSYGGRGSRSYEYRDGSKFDKGGNSFGVRGSFGRRDNNKRGGRDSGRRSGYNAPKPFDKWLDSRKDEWS
ncbi:P-loop containing nucleoside triphosphate hydrolase protein [Aspergillus venezuelensis]